MQPLSTPEVNSDKSTVEISTIAWQKAFSLCERTFNLDQIKSDSKRSEKQYKKWQEQTGLSDQWLAERINAANLSEEKFLALIGESDESLTDRISADVDWVAEVNEAYANPKSCSIIEPITSQITDQEDLRFLYAIEPLLANATERFRSGVTQLQTDCADAPFDLETVTNTFLMNVCVALPRFLNPTFVLELNVARLSGQLQGDTPEARFQSFCELLRDPQHALSILQEYPILARQCVSYLKFAVAFALEFLTHLSQDWNELRELFPQSPGKLTALSMGAGDTHRNGRAVVIAEFENDCKVVYKPRSMSIDIHFQNLLSWLNEHGDHAPFKILKTIDRGEYGWVEHIAPQECSTAAHVACFYERQGALLALLYAMGATDFHFENIMAIGEHPVLLDLESMFHPGKEFEDEQDIDDAANNAILSSVLRVGLLPHRLWIGSASEGIDISGMGASDDQWSPDELPYWESTGTDAMQLQRKRMQLSSGSHRAILNGKAVRPVQYADDVIRGFRGMYQLLVDHADDLLEENGPLDCFKQDQIRVILRHTRTYGLALQEGFHPDALRDAVDRDRLFDYLWRDAKNESRLKRVIPFEQADLRDGDIPMFTSKPGNRDIWTAHGVRIENYWNENEVASVAGRLPEMNADDLERQTWFVQASLATTSSRELDLVEPYVVKPNETPRANGDFLKSAMAIGDRLETLSIQTDDEAIWLGLTLLDTDSWSLIPSGLDFYSGLPGIAMFLGYLGELSGNEKYTRLGKLATNGFVRRIEASKELASAVGGYTGWGGLVYSLSHLGKLWNDQGLLQQATELSKSIPNLVEHDQTFDIIGGSAGGLGSLLALYEVTKDPSLLTAAETCGGYLLDQAKNTEHGICWQQGTQHPLAGFSHGAAGIAWSLLKLHQLTGNCKLQTMAQSAIDFERGLYSPEHKNWADRRLDPSKKNSHQEQAPTFLTAWCNGAPGIGMARLDTLDSFDDQQVQQEIEIAIETTMYSGFGDNHCLCHGDMGNIDLLIQASQKMPEKYTLESVQQLAAGIWNSSHGRGWLCGVPMHTETPGMLTGLSGIGYGLLRLISPERVPSVLTMEAPRS